MKFELYRRKGLGEAIPWNEDYPMELVSVSQADIDNGSPKKGDMIARNPKNHNDQWLIAKKYFEENFEEVESFQEII